jgi:hypothetical protein
MIHQDKITTINKYTQNIDTSSFIKQTLLDTKAQRVSSIPNSHQ